MVPVFIEIREVNISSHVLTKYSKPSTKSHSDRVKGKLHKRPQTCGTNDTYFHVLLLPNTGAFQEQPLFTESLKLTNHNT